MFRNTAHLYDLIYGKNKDYGAEARQIHSLVHTRNRGASSLLDVACGTGAHLAHLRQWYNVTALDADAGMLHHAARHLPGVALVEADMRSFRLDTTFDAVTSLFSSIGYMSAPADLDAAVATMAQHLRSGGGGTPPVTTAPLPDPPRSKRLGAEGQIDGHVTFDAQEVLQQPASIT